MRGLIHHLRPCPCLSRLSFRTACQGWSVPCAGLACPDSRAHCTAGSEWRCTCRRTANRTGTDSACTSCDCSRCSSQWQHGTADTDACCVCATDRMTHQRGRWLVSIHGTARTCLGAIHRGTRNRTQSDTCHNASDGTRGHQSSRCHSQASDTTVHWALDSALRAV